MKDKRMYEIDMNTEIEALALEIERLRVYIKNEINSLESSAEGSGAVLKSASSMKKRFQGLSKGMKYQDKRIKALSDETRKLKEELKKVKEELKNLKGNKSKEEIVYIKDAFGNVRAVKKEVAE